MSFVDQHFPNLEAEGRWRLFSEVGYLGLTMKLFKWLRHYLDRNMRVGEVPVTEDLITKIRQLAMQFKLNKTKSLVTHRQSINSQSLAIQIGLKLYDEAKFNTMFWDNVRKTGDTDFDGEDMREAIEQTLE